MDRRLIAFINSLPAVVLFANLKTSAPDQVEPKATAPMRSSYQKEAPRLCRGGSRSLTFQGVVHRRDFQS